MIDEKDYKLPHEEQQKPRPKADSQTLRQLEELPYKPFTCEW